MNVNLTNNKKIHTNNIKVTQLNAYSCSNDIKLFHITVFSMTRKVTTLFKFNTNLQDHIMHSTHTQATPKKIIKKKNKTYTIIKYS